MSLYEECVKRAGGEDRVCENCKPIVKCYDTVFGVRAAGDKLEDRCYFSTLLAEAFSRSATCWHCGWVVLVASNTWMSDIAANVSSPDAQLTKIEINWQSISVYKDSRAVQGHPVIERIWLSYSAPWTGSEKKSISFSKCLDKPQNLSVATADGGLIVARNDSVEWASKEPYAGRIRPAKIDLQLLKNWKDNCIRDHGGTCDQTFTTHRASHLRFVDVLERRVIQAVPDEVTWTALSYCWGGPQEHALQASNLEEYQLPGALRDDMLPAGIVDAMTLVRALGERYIWIDSLCIVQDDDMDKLEFLPMMGTIYAHSVLTIVNAANDKVAMGMPGVSNPRRMQQVHQMKDFWMVEALDLPHQRWEGYLHGSTWNARGWTFQEGLLSPRCLIIGEAQTYWQCKVSSFCEDSCWENLPGKNIYRHYSGSEIISRLTDSREENWMDLYKDVLDAYAKRELTSETDRLGAVEAILDVLRRDDEEGYFWGMPRGHLEMALSWSSHVSRNTRRDCEAKYIGPGKQVRSAPFPTWSWLGWHGATPMPSVNRAVLGGRLGLKFYRILDGGVPEALVDGVPYAGPERDFTKKDYMTHSDMFDTIGYPRGLTHPSLDYSRQSVRRADIPESVLLSKQAPSALCFWTSTAVLDMKYEGWNGFHRCPLISLSHGDVSHCGAWENDESFKPNGRGKFIVIGTERVRMSHGGQVTVNLLLVDQDDNGLSYRRRLVTYTPEEVWDSFKNRRWELIFLA
ncbi:unnamed protein product [Clonostachys rhizophaga]|uniref:Heterokaryon incompatibility domain-containing protein n=1 Tax=Clonostachys rhizophaga TaxID=160324 RepID=A0A9N9YKM0_9HYPO|nr:unnamed protein product [Clonostachys rhizophaga]